MVAPREKLLHEAASIIAGDRDAQYGGPEESFTTIARYWNNYISGLDLGHELGPDDVAVMMVLLKVARLGTGGTAQEDTWKDIAGYAGCGWEVSSRK